MFVCECVCVCVCVKYKEDKEGSRNRCVRASEVNLTGTALLFKITLAADTLQRLWKITSNMLPHTQMLSGLFDLPNFIKGGMYTIQYIW